MERKSNRKNANSNSNGYCYYDDLDQMEKKKKKKKNYIQHPVSKLDTLAGIAIKYGVDVADIKKLNGFSTDLQMFALKTLQIPLPGKHPPSPCLSNGSEIQGHINYEQRSHFHVLLDSFPSLGLKSTTRHKVSPAMSSLQGYYGLEPIDHRPASEGFKMTEYGKKEAQGLVDGPLLEPSPSHRKSKSLVNVMLAENDELADVREIESDKWSDKLFGRRQKSETDFSNSCTPDLLLKEDNSNTTGFPAITVKGLALRPKAAAAANRVDSKCCGSNPVRLVSGNSLMSDQLSGVRKSSSTSSLQDQESSIWSSSTKWTLKPDLQALSSVAITRPIFDGLPKPISGRKNK